MIPGIVAAQTTSAGGSSSGSLYPGADLVIDFIAGVYGVNGEDVAAADVIDHPELIVGDGLDINFSPDDIAVDIIGDALAVLLTVNWTLVLEYEQASSNFQTKMFTMTEEGTSKTLEIDRLGASSKRIYALDKVTTLLVREINSSALNGTEAGIHRVALTRIDSKFVLSRDGEAIVDSGESLSGVTLDYATFGSYHGDSVWDNCKIRKLIVYPPQDDSELPVLSAL